MLKDKENWKTTDINPNSLWIIERRKQGGKHENNYHGNFIPQVPNQLIRRYTNKGDTVMELFSGGGTTLYECEHLGRHYIGFDINEKINAAVLSKMIDTKNIHFSLNTCDVSDPEKLKNITVKNLNWKEKTTVDFLIAHPPYMDIIKFTDKKEDLSNVSDVNLFLDKLMLALEAGYEFLEKEKYFAIVMGDVYKNSEVIPLGFFVMNKIKQSFRVKLKGIVVKNIEGNRAKLRTENLWKYRALNSDYFLFKHEYIFIFKKVN